MVDDRANSNVDSNVCLRVYMAILHSRRLRNYLDILELWCLGFFGLALPAAGIGIAMIGLWFGLTGIVPAYLPHPLPPIIIWGTIAVMMVCSAYMEYKP